MNADIGSLTPGMRLFLTQHMFEPLLRAKCKELGAELRFSTEVVDCEQDDQGCISTVKDLETGELKRIKSKYVVACDGSRSPMAKHLGINRVGYGEMSRSITIYFHV
jgi:2-polyprenyl-6-methoxyphenol hydroxylase-like FAD-dependent oxidoreductase